MGNSGFSVGPTAVFFGLDTGSARPVQAILDSFYSSVTGGMYQVWYEGWGLFSDDFKLFEIKFTVFSVVIVVFGVKYYGLL